jgi:hypothetical protein
MVRVVDVERALAVVRAARSEVSVAEAGFEPEPEPCAMPIRIAALKSAMRHLSAAGQKVWGLLMPRSGLGRA